MSTTLKSGYSYRLHELFSGDRKIVIPDMQREYCWPSTFSETNGKSLLHNFVIGLIDLGRAHSDLGMGVLYAYEKPADFINLCDGQQRLTTLYLLIGVLCRKTGSSLKTKLSELLISTRECLDDKEPRLQYAIRESTLFFLRDLVYNYFLNIDEQMANVGSCELHMQAWYFSEYDLDPSIQNMLRAIAEIDKLISESSTDVVAFAEFVTYKVSFLYFDMENPKHGEEQFVVLNTTGKSLTTTESFKPLFLSDLNDCEIYKNAKTKLRYFADLWEDWEHFFWVNKPKKHNMADKGLNEFFRWIYIIEKAGLSGQTTFTSAEEVLTGKDFDLRQIADTSQSALTIINEYFDCLGTMHAMYISMIESLLPTDKASELKKRMALFNFLPVLAYVRLFHVEKSDDLNVFRVVRFLKSRAKTSNVSKSVIPMTIEAIKTVKLLNEIGNADIACLVEHQSSISRTLFDQGEIYKFSVYQRKLSEREVYQNAFWSAEDLNCCAGDISYLFEILGLDIYKDNDPDLYAFMKVADLVAKTINEPDDLLRRAMLTFGDYSVYAGTTLSYTAQRLSFGIRADCYRRIVQDDKVQTKKCIILSFLKRLFACSPSEVKTCSPSEVKSSMQEMIALYADESNSSPWDKVRYALIHDEKYFAYMELKQLAKICNEDKFYTLKKASANSEMRSYPW